MPQGNLISRTLNRIEPTLGSQEEEYRQTFLASDKKMFSQGLIIASGVAAAFAYNDYLFFGISRQFWLLVSARFIFIASAITFISVSNELRKPVHFDRAALAVAFIGVTVALYADSSRPSSYTILSVSSLIIIGPYLFLPGNLLVRGFPSFLMSVGNVFVASHYRSVSLFPELNLLVVSIVVANVLGISVSTRLNNSRRRNFITEANLREAKEEWERTFNAVPDLIMILDNNHKVVRVNRATEDRLGMSLEEIVGQTCFRIMHGKDRPIPSCPHSLLLADGKEHFAEVAEEHMGAVFEVSVSPLHDTEARLKGCVHVARDITARRRVEESLRQSEERYRLLVESANDLVYTTDSKGIFTFVNPAIVKMIGYSEDEVIGRRFLDFISPEHGKETERFYGTQFVTKIPQTYYECPLITKAGKVIWVGQNVQLLSDGGSAVLFQAISRDISDRKKAEDALLKAHEELEDRVRDRTAELAAVNRELGESEARFRAMFEAAEDCMFVQDLDLRYTHVNPSMERCLGRPAPELLGLTDGVLFGEQEGRHTREVGARVLLGQTVEEERTRLMHGVTTTFNDIRVPLRDTSGDIIGLFGIARNITERKNLLMPVQPVGTKPHASMAMRRTIEKALIAAMTDSMLLLTGESGSGKDYLARYIHEHSKRAAGPFFAINCAAIAPQLAETELFGHERGAFTGAAGRKRGLLELAEGGTLLLNEIGELSLPLQSKLLTFLDTRRFTRVGGEKMVSVDARLIAATNRELEKQVAAGGFRQDLFYRLNVISIVVPPLRERLDDLPVLVEEILSLLVKDLQLNYVPTLDSSTLTAFAQYRWPGNIRELRNVLERSLILCRGKVLRVDLKVSESHIETDWKWATTFPPTKPLNDTAADLKRSLINEAIERSIGNKTAAARLLKITRNALNRQMKTLGYPGSD